MIIPMLCVTIFVILVVWFLLPRVFFFQAEDGIRVHCVTGVQTCALPIAPFRRDPRKGAQPLRYRVWQPGTLRRRKFPFGSRARVAESLRRYAAGGLSGLRQ